MREKYMRERILSLSGASIEDLIQMAQEWGLDFRDNTAVEVLVGQIANAEWRNGATTSPRYPRPRRSAQYREYPAADVTGVPFEDSPYKMEAVGEAKRAPGVEFDAEFSSKRLTPGRVQIIPDLDEPKDWKAVHDYVNEKFKRRHLEHIGKFENMDSGPMNVEEEDPAVTDLRREIMQRWIGAIGGMDWYNGPNGEKFAQSHGKALAAVLDEVVHGGRVRGSNPFGVRTSSGWFIYESILPDVLRFFFKKNADYGDNHRTGLGPAAEYVGIHRKVEKLKTALWEGQEMEGEGTKEMLYDLIGQCLIVLDLIAVEENNPVF